MPNKIYMFAIAFCLSMVQQALATPEFGRRYKVQDCNTCHTVVPKLNERGYDFMARGFQPDPELNLERTSTFPLSVWLSGRVDNRISNPALDTKALFGKIELLAADSIGDNLSYFVEWRALSLETQSDGSLRDRTGRFEDLWLSWSINDRFSLTAGQFRPLQQIDAGHKLSISQPAIFGSSLAGDDDGNARLTSLRKFSTGSRSPGISLGYQSIMKENPADGLFHTASLMFPGEFSIPLTREARIEASNEFEGTPKGVVLETYYRKGLNSIGVHSFVGDRRWMAAAVGEYNVGDVFFLGGVGLDHVDGKDDKLRSSLGVEYLPQFETSSWRPGIGFRVDSVEREKPAYVPYFVLGGPNDGKVNSLLQLEYYAQRRKERLRLDWSIFF